MTAAVVLALVLWFVVPGLAGGVLLSSWAPTPGRPGMLVARCLVCGVAAWFLGSALLAGTVGLTTTGAWVLASVWGLAGAVVLGLPRCRAVVRAARPEAAYAAAVVVVGLVAWAPVGWVVLRTTWSPLGSTPWYYWSLASQVASQGHVPATSAEWGTTVPFLADYRLFSTGTAALLLQGRDADVQVLQVVCTVAVLLAGAGASCLALALGAGRVASLVAAPVTIGTGLAVVRLTSYRPEAFGLGLGLLVVALVADALRHSDRVSLALGALGSALLAQVHGIVLLTTVGMLVAVAVALAPLWTTVHQGAAAQVRPYLVRASTYGVVVALSVVLLALVLGGLSGAEHTGSLEGRGGPDDLTWDFYRAVAGLPPSEPVGNGRLLSETLSTLYRHGDAWVLVALAVAIGGLLVLARRCQEAREVLVFSAVTVVVAATVATVFALGWEGYVPRNTGQRALRQLTLLVGPVLACACGLGAARLQGRWSRLAPTVAVVVSCLAVLPNGILAAGAVSGRAPARDDLAALQQLALPQGAVVLTNAYVEGYLQQATEASGLLEGRAPYTYPDLLARADDLLRGAQDYFADPRRHRDFLTENGVDYVMVVRGKSYAAATSNVFRSPTRRNALARVHELTLVLDRPDFRVYRVDARPS